MDYTDEVVNVIKQTLGPEKEFKLTDSLKDNLKLDSLDTTELVMAIDDHFDIDVEDEDMAKIKTVQDIVDVVTAKKKTGDTT